MSPARIVTALAVAALAGGCRRHGGHADADVPRVPTVTARGEILPFSAPRSAIDFVGSKRTLSHEGRFSWFYGTIQFVPDHIERSSVIVTIATASLGTPITDLTDHLRSPDFFDVARFPEARFDSTEIRVGGVGGATHTILGTLTAHGVSGRVEFPATITVTPDEVVARGRFTLSRGAFGISPPPRPNAPRPTGLPDAIRDDVVVRLVIHAPRPRAH